MSTTDDGYRIISGLTAGSQGFNIIPNSWNVGQTGYNIPDESEEIRKKWAVSGLLIPAGLFIGMGIGWVFGYLVQGMFIGLGVGFLAMAIVRFKANQW